MEAFSIDGRVHEEETEENGSTEEGTQTLSYELGWRTINREALSMDRMDNRRVFAA